MAPAWLQFSVGVAGAAVAVAVAVGVGAVMVALVAAAVGEVALGRWVGSVVAAGRQPLDSKAVSTKSNENDLCIVRKRNPAAACKTRVDGGACCPQSRGRHRCRQARGLRFSHFKKDYLWCLIQPILTRICPTD